MTVISLGAGVQSTTVALMAAKGEITPMPDCAVFADTQDETLPVYLHLRWLTGCDLMEVTRQDKDGKEISVTVARPGSYSSGVLPFVTHIATAGSLSEAACRVRVSKKTGDTYTRSAIPAHAKDPETGKVGFVMRQCTGSHKLEVIYRTYRKIRQSRHVEQWLGISKDEATRMKPPPKAVEKWVTNRYPLIDRRMSRNDCLRWMEAHGYPKPPRSACAYCPFKSDAEWRDLKVGDPSAFAFAVKVERDFQAALAQVPSFRGIPFLHKSLTPLDQVDFTSPADNQLNLFENECQGMCGV